MNKDSIAERRFVQLILAEEGNDLDPAHKKAISQFLTLDTGHKGQFI